MRGCSREAEALTNNLAVCPNVRRRALRSAQEVRGGYVKGHAGSHAGGEGH